MTWEALEKAGKGSRRHRGAEPMVASNTSDDGLPPENAPIPSQTDAALDFIRSRIIDLTLEPGSRIDERLLISQFRLGRTPAREAINRLVAEGFVKILPKRGGTYVRKLDFAEMGEVIVAHQMTESVLGQMCRLDDPTLVPDLKAIHRKYVDCVAKRDFLEITKLNQEFHLRLHQTVGNALFYDFARSTHRHVRRLNVFIYKAEMVEPANQSIQFANDLDQHNQIIEAVEQGNREALAELLPTNARLNQTRLLRLLENKTVGRLTLDLSEIDVP